MTRGLLLAVLLTACTRSPQVYGEAAEPTALRDSARVLEGAPTDGEVTVSGVVGEVCPMGCWFYLLGESSMVYVDLDLGSGFVIPKDSSGRKAVVRGRLSGDGAGTRLKAQTVVLYSR